MWCWRDSIFRTRGEFSPQKSVSPRKKYSHQKQLIFLYFPCYGTMGSLSPFVFFYAFVDIAIRLFATDLSLLIRFSVIEVKQKEVVTVTSVRYSCKTSKTSKTNSNTVLVKKTYAWRWAKISTDQYWLRKSSLTEKAPLMTENIWKSYIPVCELRLKKWLWKWSSQLWILLK